MIHTTPLVPRRGALLDIPCTCTADRVCVQSMPVDLICVVVCGGASVCDVGVQCGLEWVRLHAMPYHVRDSMPPRTKTLLRQRTSSVVDDVLQAAVHLRFVKTNASLLLAVELKVLFAARVPDMDAVTKVAYECAPYTPLTDSDRQLYRHAKMMQSQGQGQGAAHAHMHTHTRRKDTSNGVCTPEYNAHTPDDAAHA